MVHVMLFPTTNVLYFYISTFRNIHIRIITVVIIVIIVVVLPVVVVIVRVMAKGRLEWQVAHVLSLVYRHTNYAEVTRESQPNCFNVFSI